MVGAAHTNLPKVQELVSEQPELARACWDWGFGDFESALGAAAHMGRRDIAEFLLANGARPDIFTFAMLGSVESVRAMIEAVPGVQRTLGPHGITLLQHAKNRLRHKDLSATDEKSVQAVITYLEALGDADPIADSIPMTEEEKQLYLGEYRFGDGDSDVFIVSQNMRKMLAVARKGDFGRALVKVGDHLFRVDGTASGKVRFAVENGVVKSLSILARMPEVTAARIG